MSLSATVLATWCAIYAIAAAYHLALWGRTERRDPEHLAYACMCLGLAIYTAGSALLVDASTLAQGALAVRVQHVGGFACIAFFVDLASHMIERPRRRFVLATYVAAALATLVAVTGRLVDPTTSALDAFGRGSHVEPAFRAEGMFTILLMLVLAVVAGVELFRRARTDADARVIVLGTTIAIGAGAHDNIVRIAGLDSPRLVEHAALATVLTVGFVLLRRFVRDATELERRTDELGRSYDELRHTQEELVRQEQLAAVGELSAVIAHEVRNPLAILKNAVSSLRRPTLTMADRGVLLGILDEETDRLNRLVRDLLAYARPVAPKGAAVELESLVIRAFEIARSGRPDARNVELALELEQGPAAVRGDPELLRHACVNVIDNALQAMPGGGKLLARCVRVTSDPPARCRLSFSDTGEGMDTLVRAKALDPFFTTRPAGTGLGLAIVDRVVKNHGGSLAIESAPGGGTTVTLTLPVAE